MTDRDDYNLRRFLRDLANPAFGVSDRWPGGTEPSGAPRLNPANDAAARERASARLRGDRFTPSPEATDGLKRPQTGAGKRDGANLRVPRWPIRAWWHRD